MGCWTSGLASHAASTAARGMVCVGIAPGARHGEAASLDIRLEAGAGVTLPRVVVVEAFREPDGSSESSHHTDDPRSTHRLPVGTGRWRAVVHGDGLWAQEQRVRIDDPHDSRPLVFKLWPGGHLAGRVEVAAAEPVTSIEITLESPPGGRSGRIGRVTQRCPVAQGKWSCAVPAVELDVEFRLEGFVSHHRRLRADAGGALDVGLLPFVRGAVDP